jgi:hypothetical protein
MDPEPIIRTFQVGKPVKLDFREAIERYIKHGARKMPSVQVLVCGHFKTQRHGPRNSLTKIIWIQPFWRGPADAPILVRPHSFGEKSNAVHSNEEPAGEAIREGQQERADSSSST